jgi:hypothetical protein
VYSGRQNKTAALWSGAAALCLFLFTISGLVARLIRIAITAAAYEAIATTLPLRQRRL